MNSVNIINIPSFSLNEKVAIVTGGTRGIGHGIACTLAAYGANVVITGRSQAACDKVACEIESNVIGIAADVTQEDARRALIEQTVAHFGHIDILVNNAGVGGREFPLFDMTMEEWNTTLDADLTAVFRLSCLAAEQMKAQGRDGTSMPYRIVNMASVAALKSAKYTSAYAAAKAGVLHLTRVMANEWARYGITVNSIAPGTIVTDMTSDVRADEKNANAVLRAIAMRRFGQVEDIAGSALFLVSDAASYITGINIPVDGGMLLN